jgi:hypothetical protein
MSAPGKLARPLKDQVSTDRSGFKGRTNLTSFEEHTPADKAIINRVEEIAKWVASSLLVLR